MNQDTGKVFVLAQNGLGFLKEESKQGCMHLCLVEVKSFSKHNYSSQMNFHIIHIYSIIYQKTENQLPTLCLL